MTEHAQPITEKLLYRSTTDRVIAGVAGGLGEYFSIDPTVIRVLFVLVTLFGGVGIPAYIILWVVTPAKEAGEGVTPTRFGTTKTVLSLILMGLGVLFLLDNFGWFNSKIFWPLALILIGFVLLRRQ